MAGDPHGYLIDVDGTLLSGDREIPGSQQFLGRLRSSGIPFRIVTNTTRRPRGAVARTLRTAGIDVRDDEVLAPAALARRTIAASGRRRTLLLVADGLLEDLDGVESCWDAPDWVVVGDLGPEFTWERLNQAFRALLDGASLLALHVNRYWHDGDRGPKIDAGAFVRALEYAADVRAEVLGKPSPEFYRLALDDLGIAAQHTVMIGDDVRNDGIGAGQAGLRSILVRTGKFREADLGSSGFIPERVIASIAELVVP